MDNDNDGTGLPALDPIKKNWEPGNSHERRAVQAMRLSTPRLDPEEKITSSAYIHKYSK